MRDRLYLKNFQVVWTCGLCGWYMSDKASVGVGSDSCKGWKVAAIQVVRWGRAACNVRLWNCRKLDLTVRLGSRGIEFWLICQSWCECVYLDSTFIVNATKVDLRWILTYDSIGKTTHLVDHRHEICLVWLHGVITNSNEVLACVTVKVSQVDSVKSLNYPQYL